MKILIKYLLVGGVTALLEFTAFLFLRRILYISVPMANIIAMATATCVNYLLNRNWSFQSSSKISRSLSLYIMLIGFNLFFTTFMITLMVSWGVADWLAKFIMMAASTTWNFMLYRTVIFK